MEFQGFNSMGMTFQTQFPQFGFPHEVVVLSTSAESTPSSSWGDWWLRLEQGDRTTLPQFKARLLQVISNERFGLLKVRRIVTYSNKVALWVDNGIVHIVYPHEGDHCWTMNFTPFSHPDWCNVLIQRFGWKAKTQILEIRELQYLQNLQSSYAR